MTRKKRERTNPKTLELDARHLMAYRLRMAGAKLRDIGDALGYKTCSGAQKAIEAGQRKLHVGPAINSKILNQDRLEEILCKLWPAASKGVLGSTDRVLKIVKELNKMDGNYEPLKIAPTDPTGQYEYGADARNALLGKLIPELAGRGEASEAGEPD